MNAPLEPEDEGDCPVLEDIPSARRREYLARVRLIIGPPAIIITRHVVMGPYILSAEAPVDEISLAEARQLHEALGDAIAAYESRALAELDTEPEPYLHDLLTKGRPE